MQEIITAWQTGLFYSKFMLIFWITVPLMALIILHFLEKNTITRHLYKHKGMMH